LIRAEARRLLAEREGRLCVRILRRSDGTVVTADCWTRLRAARRRGIAPFLAMLLVVAWAELLAIRFGLGRSHRFVANPPVPGPSFVADNRHLRDRHIMGVFGRKVIRREPEPDWLRSKTGPRARADICPPPLTAAGQSGTRRPSRLIAIWVTSGAIDDALISNRFKNI
jgi:hypothetical protein